jgi:4-diphosphocytidyl-2-C-methyl-D-erythritol kinase
MRKHGERGPGSSQKKKITLTTGYGIMEFTAPAKLNLYLRVVGRRDDGYHQIETLFERISILDRIDIELSDRETEIISTDPTIPTGEDSLIGRTLSAFKAVTGDRSCFRIKLEKNIPVGAGLGGGSSDAAALLKGLNTLTGSPLDKETLMRIARPLGADVPFFIEETPFGLGRGRGDIIEAVETDLELAHIVINPPLYVSTKEIYAKVSPLGLTTGDAWDKMLTLFLLGKDIKGIAQNLRNDLQQIVLQEFPALARVFSALRSHGAEGVIMSGSGPTVFGVFKEDLVPEASDRICREFPEVEGWRVYTPRTYRRENKK